METENNDILHSTPNETNTNDQKADEQDVVNEINELIKMEKFDATTAINILINAVQASYDKEHFNDLDRYLIAKALTCFKEASDGGNDIVIKVK